MGIHGFVRKDGKRACRLCIRINRAKQRELHQYTTSGK